MHDGAELREVAPDLEPIITGRTEVSALHPASEIRRETVWVAMRDGVRLATDLYLPPRTSAPAVAGRTPYGRASRAKALLGFAQRGYIVISQDCRGTGDSEPDCWDFYVYEREDSVDFVEWVTQQRWFAGFLGSYGGSYVGGTQWCMAMHPSMSAIAPEVAGVGVVPATRPRFYMFVNAYSLSVGKGADKLPIGREELEKQMLEETLAGGYFNEALTVPFSEALLERHPDLGALPHREAQRRLWERYSASPPAERAALIKVALGEETITFASMEALSAVFGHQISSDAHMLPRARDSEVFQSLQAPALLITGWYDWGLDDTLATWELLNFEGREPVRSRSRLLITPGAHNVAGYHEGHEQHSELDRIYRTEHILDLLLHWYETVREEAFDSWPAVVYYMMGANEWRATSAWPPEAEICQLYLAADGQLTPETPPEQSGPDTFTYDPEDPTPTVGGSILSYVYPAGSVDVSEVQQRADVLTYTTASLDHDLDVVGPLHLILYASSSALDTDFSARISDVFPDGRAIQLQTATLRARFRNRTGDPALLEPGQIYCFEIDMWATANRFTAGHCLRIDIASADFPRFDRNTNRGGTTGPPIAAEQTIYHDADHPSHIRLPIIDVVTRAPSLRNVVLPSVSHEGTHRHRQAWV